MSRAASDRGGRFLQVRLNPDRDLVATSIGWAISAMEAATSEADSKQFRFPQPALVFLLGRP